MRTQTSSSRQQGFSLLEVLVALVILSIGLLALASLQIGMIRSSAQAKAQSIAMAVAKERIETLRSYTSTADYVALADEAVVTLADVGGNQGGIDFTRKTTIVRYVYDGTSNAFEARGTPADLTPATDIETDAALKAVTGNTYKPGKEFKRIKVLVGWSDATGGAQQVALEDAIGSIDPGDTIDLQKPSSTSLPRTAQVLRTNPGDTAGVIPIAIGNGTSTAATNPTPEVNANNQGSKVVETRFEVLTYAALNSSDDAIVKAQSRVETAIVSCQCDYGTAPDAADEVKGYRPTYWNGSRYAAPERADYLVPAGEEVLANNAIQQSEKCGVCCRDHNDPTTTTTPKFAPRRSSHTHNYLSGATLTPAVPSSGDNFLEVCRVVRVDGIFRVATDMYNDRENLVETDNFGATPYPGSAVTVGDPDEGEEHYAGFVLDYLHARVVGNATAATYNSKLRVRSAADAAGEAVVDAAIKVIEDANSLNNPALLEMARSSDFKWLHSRGLYIDYLEEDARDAILAAKAACKGTDGLSTGLDDAELQACVLPLMPFTSINTSEIARWTVTTEPELTVSNADFKLVTDATGATDPIKGRVLPDTGAVSNDDPHPYSSSNILDSNAGLAARDVAVNLDEIDINDKQVFDITSGPAVGSSSGTVYVRIAGGTGVLPNYATTQAPQAFYKFKFSAPTLPAACVAVTPSTTAGYPNPYTCQDALVGGNGVGVIQSYNYSPVAKLAFVGDVTCTKNNGGAITVAMNRTDRPQCKNLDVASAQLERASSIVETGTGKVELNDGLTTEITTFNFNNVLTGDVIIFNFADETTSPYPAVSTSDYTCTYNGNPSSQTQSTVTFAWKAQCPAL